MTKTFIVETRERVKRTYLVTTEDSVRVQDLEQQSGFLNRHSELATESEMTAEDYVSGYVVRAILDNGRAAKPAGSPAATSPQEPALATPLATRDLAAEATAEPEPAADAEPKPRRRRQRKAKATTSA